MEQCFTYASYTVIRTDVTSRINTFVLNNTRIFSSIFNFQPLPSSQSASSLSQPSLGSDINAGSIPPPPNSHANSQLGPAMRLWKGLGAAFGHEYAQAPPPLWLATTQAFLLFSSHLLIHLHCLPFIIDDINNTNPTNKEIAPKPRI